MTKQQCKALAPAGWEYIDKDGSFVYYQSGNYASGFKMMRCSIAEDMTKENIALMARMCVTR